MEVAIVDDNAVNLRLFESVVSRISGVTTRTYASSEDALTACTRKPPDMIVLDNHVPEVDAMAFMAGYRKTLHGPETPILIITADADRDLRRQALEAGASDFLSKPADPVEFVARVRNLLASVQLRRQIELRMHVLTSASSHAISEADALELETINLLMRAVEYRENPTGMHGVRMGQYATAIGEYLGLPEVQLRLLLFAAPMHDVGKVAISDAVLLKPDTLTSAEMEQVKSHSMVGYQILSSGKSQIAKMAADIARSHHERWNGEGYPHGLRGEAISLPARIAAVADAFDAMLTHRPYRPARTNDEVFDQLRSLAGVFYDPAIVAIVVRRRSEMLAIASGFADNSVW